MWASTMAENRIIKLGKNTDFQSHHIAHQMGAYTGCNHGCALAVVQPAYYRYIYINTVSINSKDSRPRYGASRPKADPTRRRRSRG